MSEKMTDPAYPGGPPAPAPAPAQPAPVGQQQYPPPPGYGAQPAGYPPPPAYTTQPGYAPRPGQTTVVVQPTIMRGVMPMRESPVTMQCPHCNATITSSTTYETGTLVWVVAGVLCLVGLWAGCCLIPFCIPSCKDVVHTCPNCRVQLGRYNRM